MRRYLPSIGVKFISLLLSFAILFQCNTMAFANIGGLSFGKQGYTGGVLSSLGVNEEDFESLAAKLEESYLKGTEGNIYEANLNREASSKLKELSVSAEKAGIARLTKDGKAKYGLMYPTYVKASGAKALAKLEAGLKDVLGVYFAKFEVLPYKEFEKDYRVSIDLIAKEYGASNAVEVPFRQDGTGVINEIMAAYPAKTAYIAYQQEAKAEIVWREANKAKVEESVYTVIRAYVEAIGVENLSLEVISTLINLDLSGKKIISTAERTNLYNYTVTRLEKQKLDLLELGIFDGNKDKKVAAVLLKDLIEAIVLGGYVAANDSGRYAKAVENIIYTSEDGVGFSHLLSSGFSALLGVGAYGSLDRILARYTEKEQEGASFGDYLSLTYYAGKIETAKGKFLGKASELTQYNTDYVYGNTFMDMALLLGEDGREGSIKLLKKYSSDKAVIKPFIAGALTSGKSGLDSKAATSYALSFANLSFRDISGIQEYDVDKALLNKYPGIKGGLGADAIVDKASLENKIENKKAFGYVNRAALSGDILIMIWGTIGLAKLGIKGAKLGRSTYLAIKAGRISGNVERIAYIKANYAKIGSYVSARNNLLRLSSRIKSGMFKVKGLGKGGTALSGVESSRESIKLQNYFNKQQLGRLYEVRKEAVMAVRNASKPTARQTAKADFATAQYKAKASQMNFLRKARSGGATSFEAKNASYLEKVKEYNRAAELYNAKVEKLANLKGNSAPSNVVKSLESEISVLRDALKAEPSLGYGAAELEYVNAYNKFNGSLSNLKTARSVFKNTSFWNRNISNPLNTWWQTGRGDGTLGIAGLETGPTVTLAEILGINSPYNPDYTKGFSTLGSKAKPTQVDKFYKFLSNHKMGHLASGLKFVNNRATLFGTTLLLNYNIATVTPEAINTARMIGANTELVMNAGKTSLAGSFVDFMAGKKLPILPSSIKPVSVIDPKIFEIYRTIPLPGGSIVSSFSLAAPFRTAYSVGTVAASAVAMPLMFGRDLYIAFDARLMNVKSNFKVKTPITEQVRESISVNAAIEWGAYRNNLAPQKYVYEVPGIPHLFHSKKYYLSSGSTLKTQQPTKESLRDSGRESLRDKRAAGQQKIAEEKALSSAWDEVKGFRSKGKNNANRLMAAIDIDGLKFKVYQGHIFIDRTGKIIVQGQVLKQVRGTFANFGLAKIIFKHSDKTVQESKKYQGEKYITKGDFINLATILREYSPISSDRDYPNKVIYRIEGEDKQDLLIVFGKEKSGDYSLITMFYEFRKGASAYSEKLNRKSARAVENEVAKQSFNTIVNTKESIFASDAQLVAGMSFLSKKGKIEAITLPSDMSMEGRYKTVGYIDATGVEKVLPVELSFNEDFDNKGYTNVVFNNNVAELREFGKTPRVMSNFFLTLKMQHKSLNDFVDALKASGEKITVKYWQYGIEPANMVTVPLFLREGKEELPIKVITDANLLKEEGSKLVLTPSGRIAVMQAKSVLPDIIDASMIIRVPKNQREVFVKVLEGSKSILPIEIMPSYNKADIITREGFLINPSLGKTLGPVLPASLGISESLATNLMYIVNYVSPILAPLLNPLIKKYGEVAVLKASLFLSIAASLLAISQGFYGYAHDIEPTLIRNIVFITAMVALAGAMNIRQIVSNALINMNRGAMPISKKSSNSSQAAEKITFNMVVKKFNNMFTTSSDLSMGDIIYYNLSYIYKNLGTMAFLIAPPAVNFAGKLLGFDFNLGWDASLPLYAAYAGYSTYKIYNTKLRDSKIVEHIKNDVYETLVEIEANAAQAAKSGTVVKEDKSFWKDVGEIFNIMFKKEGVLSVSLAMMLATAHEFSISSAFSSTLNDIFTNKDIANIIVVGVLYGALVAGRLLGNMVSTRISSYSSYILFSGLSLLGTGMMVSDISNPAMVIPGAVVASLGMGNYFSQMYAYIIRKHPKLQSQVSQVLSYTMPAAVVLSSPITYLNEWTGIPYMRALVALMCLVGSLMLTKDMMSGSTLYKYVEQEIKDFRKEYFGKKKKGEARKDNNDNIPTDMNNPQPN